MKTIEVSASVYEKLNNLVEGFGDTPNQVIERLINNVKPTKSTIRNNMDHTKYIFNDYPKIYNKRRLVLAVVTKYVQDNGDISYLELEMKFPKSLQGPFGVFDKFEEGITQRNRFFTKEEELIQLLDGCIAVCGEWGIGNIGDFIKQSKALGYTINKYEGKGG